MVGWRERTVSQKCSPQVVIRSLSFLDPLTVNFWIFDPLPRAFKTQKSEKQSSFHFCHNNILLFSYFYPLQCEWMYFSCFLPLASSLSPLKRMSSNRRKYFGSSMTSARIITNWVKDWGIPKVNFIRISFGLFMRTLIGRRRHMGHTRERIL